MSWFDAAGLANIAKSALKEAQKTIDKALDIREEDLVHVPANTPVDSDDFFNSWSVSAKSDHSVSGELVKEVITKSPGKSSQKMTGSLWGSFTGSFFDATLNTTKHPKSPTCDSLDDSADFDGEEGFSQSKLVVQQSEDSEGSAVSRLSLMEEEKTVKDLLANITYDVSGNYVFC